jgi:small membrane protein
MTIKILLLLGLLSVGIYAFRRTSSAAHLAVRRLAGLLILLLGALSVLFPDITSRAADLVGVKRGADLVFYALTVTSLFVWASVYARLHDLEERYADIVRTIAIREAEDSGWSTRAAKEQSDAEGS